MNLPNKIICLFKGHNLVKISAHGVILGRMCARCRKITWEKGVDFRMLSVEIPKGVVHHMEEK